MYFGSDFLPRQRNFYNIPFPQYFKKFFCFFGIIPCFNHLRLDLCLFFLNHPKVIL